MTLRVTWKGNEGVKGSNAMARWEPTKRPERDRPTVPISTTRNAMKEYPPLREMMSGEISGMGRSLDAARNRSRSKEEKEVKEPQKPVARPM